MILDDITKLFLKPALITQEYFLRLGDVFSQFK